MSINCNENRKKNFVTFVKLEGKHFLPIICDINSEKIKVTRAEDVSSKGFS